ncbi:hypothetical protein EMCRGX_G009875 [Ephydatia muelleri]
MVIIVNYRELVQRQASSLFDICVTSPLNTLTLSEAGGCAGAAAQAREVRKHSANDDKCGDPVKCGDLGRFCVPLVTETYGAWGPEAKACFSQLALRLFIRLQKPKSVILHELYGHLNTRLVRCVATAILNLALVAGRGGGNAGCKAGEGGLSFFAPVAVCLYSEWDTNPSQLRALRVIGSVLSHLCLKCCCPH